MSEPKTELCPICGAPIRENPGLTPRCDYDATPLGYAQDDGRPEWAWDLEHRVNRLAARLAALEGDPQP